MSLLPDPRTRFGARVQRKLRDERLVWLTSVGHDGTPQPNPVWFLWEGDTFLVYNAAHARRLGHIRRRPRVSLHFETGADADDVVVFTGVAEVAEGQPPPHLVPEYVARYGEDMARISGSLEAFSAEYPVPVRVRVSGVRGV
jgi:PPOX class probable F420-dependent enzyme